MSSGIVNPKLSHTNYLNNTTVMPLNPFFVFTLLLFASVKTVAQTEIITIDPSAAGGAKNMPYDKEFYIKMPVDAKEVFSIYYIERYKNRSFHETIKHYIKKEGKFIPDSILLGYTKIYPGKGKDTLMLKITDKYLFKPSEVYFIVILLKKLNEASIKFFDFYYLEKFGSETNKSEVYSLNAMQSLTEYDKGIKEHYGENINFGNYTLAEYIKNRDTFSNVFKKEIYPGYKTYMDALHRHLLIAKNNAAHIASSMDILKVITHTQLNANTAINKEAIDYLMSKESLLNRLINDLNTLVLKNDLEKMVTGSISIDSIFYDSISVKSPFQKDFHKRVANIDGNIKALNILKRALFLLSPGSESSGNKSNPVNIITQWIGFLQNSKKEITEIIKLKAKIENRILDTYFNGMNFVQPLMAMGNTYLKFEAQSSAMLSADFGGITSSMTQKGRDLGYHIIPYLGFQLSLMPFDRDIPFSNYKKHWKQSFSVMVGWSLVNIEKDSTSGYENFFEKSTMLTGIGCRLNNTLRLTAGCQWLFKTPDNSQNRKLLAYPYLGVSIDIKVGNYLNGFIDILSGIGKGRNSSNSTPTTNISK